MRLEPGSADWEAGRLLVPPGRIAFDGDAGIEQVSRPFLG